MELSEEMKALKEQVENLLSRKGSPKNPEEIRIALKVIDFMIPHRMLHIVADSQRVARDFAEVMCRPYKHIKHREDIVGYNKIHVVVLHTGHRTDHQKANYLEVRELIRIYCRDVITWHIGEWR